MDVGLTVGDDSGIAIHGTVPVTATANPTKNLRYVRILIDGVVAFEIPASPAVYQWNTTTVADGTHVVSALAQYKSRKSTAQLAVTVNNAVAPPPPPAAHLTGTHWANPNEYATLKQVGYGFSVTNVAPGDIATAKARLDAADAAGIKLIIGLYAFGGPEPYVLKADGTWTISAAAVQSLDYLESRQSSIIALFGFNEPYWVAPDGHTDSCGVFSAAQLRQFRTQIRAIWPGAKIYHDIGWPSEWAPGGDFHQAYSCIGNKYADATGVADYVGVWDYPFTTSGYMKTQGLARLAKETSYVANSMGAVPVWLGQAHSIPSAGLAWPTDTQLKDWNCSVRSALPSDALISWYVWRQEIYADYLVNHPTQWPLTVASACP